MKNRKNTRRSNKNERREYGSTPKLVCILTGQERATNMDYLEHKAQVLSKKAGRTVTVEDITRNYICRDAIKLLREGKTAKEIMAKFKYEGKPVADRRAKELILFNSKTAAAQKEENNHAVAA
jgi:hypothetical protein